LAKDILDLRCKHRHNILSHPACFARGEFIIPEDWTDRDYERVMEKPWWTMPGYKIGYLDIEVSNLKANFGIMLSWAIKDKDGEIHYDVITQDEIFTGKQYDKRIVQSLVEKMSEYKILVTYYGTGFDIPYMRSKAMYWDIPFPGWRDIYHWDLYYHVKRNLQLHRRSLAVATEYLGIEGKTPIKGKIWMDATFGYPDALEEVVFHNIEDVKITEQLHNRLTEYGNWTRRSI